VSESAAARRPVRVDTAGGTDLADFVVFVVDRNADVRRATAACLRHGLGVQAVPLSGAAVALALAPRTRPSLVLIDLATAERDGDGLVSGLRELPEAGGVRIAAMGGGPEAHDRARELGCDAFIAKPFRRRDLLIFVRDCLGPPRADRASPAA
jgi:CheY-like chemotaxis protein